MNPSPRQKSKRPNVILVLTDDQGYGDLGCTGNPWIKTPNIDRFHDEAVRLTDFHVQPLCTPTRGSIMSGHRPVRNGAWATCWGRSILKADEVTLASVFQSNGYRTGLFGKWHLGDNYPCRPQDRGFETVVAHKGGGVGNTPDFWGNSYFDDTYFANGQPTEYAGYCTDVWFQQAQQFIRGCGRQPFFACITTNAPHHPYLVEARYAAPYRGVEGIRSPEFYGMIANIDENFGRLRAFLAANGLEDNAILMFMTDNGSSAGARLDERGFEIGGYNAGMRGMKCSRYDGGHRVPWFVRWPAGGLAGGRTVAEMALDVDFMPTLIELCGLTPPHVDFDGQSVASLLRGETERLPGDRIHHIALRQGTELPDIWDSCVMTRDWRLVLGTELYDIKADPEQRHDVAARHPEVVRRLRDAHQRWWEEMLPRMTEYAPISLGAAAENPTRLDAMDVLGDVAWNQNHIAAAHQSTGTWAVKVERPGRYRFALRRWPAELGLPIDGVISPADVEALAPYDPRTVPQAIRPVRARIRLFDLEQTVEIAAGEREAVVEFDLPKAGETRLDAWFADAAGAEQGAYYVYVERVDLNPEP